MRKIIYLVLMILFLLPDINAYAKETPRKVPEEAVRESETFAEYTIRKNQEEIDPSGMTFEEYTRSLLGEEAFEEEEEYTYSKYNDSFADVGDIDAITIPDDEGIGLFSSGLLGLILVNFILTLFVYMVIPVIIRIRSDGPLDKKKATKVALINAIVVGLICAVIETNNGGEWTATTCLLYFFINRFVLTYKRKIKGQE